MRLLPVFAAVLAVAVSVLAFAMSRSVACHFSTTAAAHFMEHRYVAFNALRTIRPPVAP